MNPTWLHKNFEQIANMPGSWEGSADQLLAAARVLKERRQAAEASREDDWLPSETMLRPAELMLRGFALENLLKALMVKRGAVLVRDGKYIGPGHGLAQLAADVKLELDLFLVTTSTLATAAANSGVHRVTGLRLPSASKKARGSDSTMARLAQRAQVVRLVSVALRTFAGRHGRLDVDIW